ncbi:unnamed protein product [Lymnaea stagnalis]|uniref:Immunoglobulin subtype domain-containing protein n=1 Tax=Lymnaea stagnalis TaxID=6523 RepID=A0AAV2IKV1_LYMST
MFVTCLSMARMFVRDSCCVRMSRTTFCFLLFLFMGLSFADWASEGDQHLFLCVGNVQREIPILWKLRRSNGAETKLMFCTSESCDPETDGIPYEANITRNGEIFHSLLLIKNVTLNLHKSQWICFVDSNTGSSYVTNINTTFNLFVFGKYNFVLS